MEVPGEQPLAAKRLVASLIRGAAFGDFRIIWKTDPCVIPGYPKISFLKWDIPGYAWISRFLMSKLA